jgi:hypothetical protein
MKVYAARDKNGMVCLYYGRKPVRGDEVWLIDDEGKENCNTHELATYLYPADIFVELTWESEPIEIVLKTN